MVTGQSARLPVCRLPGCQLPGSSSYKKVDHQIWKKECVFLRSRVVVGVGVVDVNAAAVVAMMLLSQMLLLWM